MPEKRTVQRARRKARQRKSPSTQAAEFVREEIHHVREGKHGARSTKQAIAIGLSKARRAGVPLQRKKGIKVPKRSARPSRRRSAASLRRLKREPRRAASHRALSRQAHQSARQRGPADRQRAGRRAARTRRATR
jgi:hypothetical protein